MKKNRGSCFKSAADPMKRTFVKIQTILGPNIDPVHTCQKFKNIHWAIYIPNFALK